MTDKQEAFCREYLIDRNGTQAAIRAGYSERSARSTASVLLTNPNILTRVRALQREQVERLTVSADYVVLKLLDALDKCLAAVPVTEWDPDAGEMVKTGEYTFDSRGALKALELLGKHFGMFGDKLEINGSIKAETSKLDALIEQMRGDGK